MSGEYNTEETAEDCDYGRTGNRKTVLLILLAVLLVAAAVAAVSMGKQWSSEQAKTLSLQQQMESVTNRMSEVEGRNAELSGLLADKQAENDRLKDEWSTQVETLKQQHKDHI